MPEGTSAPGNNTLIWGLDRLGNQSTNVATDDENLFGIIDASKGTHFPITPNETHSDNAETEPPVDCSASCNTRPLRCSRLSFESFCHTSNLLLQEVPFQQRERSLLAPPLLTLPVESAVIAPLHNDATCQYRLGRIRCGLSDKNSPSNINKYVSFTLPRSIFTFFLRSWRINLSVGLDQSNNALSDQVITRAAIDSHCRDRISKSSRRIKVSVRGGSRSSITLCWFNNKLCHTQTWWNEDWNRLWRIVFFRGGIRKVAKGIVTLSIIPVKVNGGILLEFVRLNSHLRPVIAQEMSSLPGLWYGDLMKY